MKDGKGMWESCMWTKDSSRMIVKRSRGNKNEGVRCKVRKGQYELVDDNREGFGTKERGSYTAELNWSPLF